MLAGQLRHAPRATGLILIILAFLASDCFSIETREEAINAARKGRNEFFAQAYLNRGREDLERGDYLRAIRVLSAAINKEAVPEAFKWRGQAYDRAGNYEKALQDLGQYIGYDPSNPEGYILRADTRTFRHHFPNAIEDYNKAIQLDPSSVGGHLGRGLAYLGLEQCEGAIRDFHMVLKYQPQNQDALQNLGVAYMLSAQPDKALDFFEKAAKLETDPKWTEKLQVWITKAQQDPRPQTVDRPPGDHVWSAAIEDTEQRAVEPPPLAAQLPTEDSGSKPFGDGRGTERGLRDTASAQPIDKLGALERSFNGRPPGTYESVEPSQKITGDWDSTYMGTKLRFSVFQQTGTRVSGVLRVSNRGGKEDLYHFSGTFDRGNISVSHSEGHSFRGTLGNDGRLTGVVKTGNGQEMSVSLSKH